jgi:HAMP domain-containing protein
LTPEAVVSIISAVGIALVALMLRRIERRLDHIEELRINDAKQQAHAEAFTERLRAVEVESRKWDDVIGALTELSRQLAGMIDRQLRREERREA